MSYDRTVRLAVTDFDAATAAVRQALADQGFGILTEIDVQATLKAKLGHDMENYLILGACNPPFAHHALEAYRSIGLLLPCNVVVRRDGDHTLVQALDPDTMVTSPAWTPSSPSPTKPPPDSTPRSAPWPPPALSPVRHLADPGTRCADRAHAWQQESGEPGPFQYGGRGLDPLPVGVRAGPVVDRTARQTVAVCDLDRVHAGLVERCHDAGDIDRADAVANGVHAVPEGDVLDVDLRGHRLSAFAAAIRSATWSPAAVMMSRLPA